MADQFGMKRVADSERVGYGSDFGMGNENVDKPKQATAAQLAARKIKQPRGRSTARPTATTTPQSAFGASTNSPFNSINANALANNPSQPSSGFVFGTSVNGANGANGASQPNNPPSSGFSFNSSTGFSGSNPFASTSANNSSAPPSFSGNIFNTSKENQPPGINSQSTSFQFGADASKPAQSSNLFNFGQQPAAPQTNGFNFGAQSNTNSNNIFNMQSSPPQNSTTSDAMMMSPEKPASGNAQTGFGAGTTQPKFAFGQTASQNGAAESPAKIFQPSIFGTPKSDQQPTKSTNESAPSTLSSSLFGTPKPAEQSKQTSAETPATTFQPSLFKTAGKTNGDASNSGSNPASNLFAGPPSVTAQTPSTGFNFGKPTFTQPASQPPAPAFSFSQTPKPDESQTDKPSSNASATPAGKPLFGFDKPSKLEEAKGDTKNSQASSTEAPKFAFGQSTFGQPAAQAEKAKEPETRKISEPAKAPSFFAQPTAKPAVPPTPSFGEPANTPANTPGFSLGSGANQSQTTTSLFKSAAPPSERPLEASTPTPAQAFTPMTSQTGTAKEAAKVDTQKTPQKDITQSRSSSSNASNLFASVLKSAESATKTSTSTTSSSTPIPSETKAATPAKAPVNVELYKPTNLPRYLNDEGRVQVDRALRLRALNTMFQKRLSELDPGSSDIEPLIRFYVSARRNIGADIGLYERATAGSKRKADSGAESDGLGDASKKPRSDANLITPNSAAAELQFQPSASTTPSGNMFAQNGSASAPPKAPGNLFQTSTAVSGTNNTATTSSTSSATKSNLFGIESHTPAAVPKSTFILSTPAVGSEPITAPSTAPTFKPTGSATPAGNAFKRTTAPVPGGSSLQLPKFGSGNATNFFSQFGEQSKKNVEALQKEKREKRKAEDFDSDEDDEAEFDQKLEEEERAKRARLEEAAASASNFFVFKPAEPTGPQKADATKYVTEKPKASSWFTPSGTATPSTSDGRSVFDTMPSYSAAQFANPFASLQGSDAGNNDGDDEGSDNEQDDDDEKEDPSYDPAQDKRSGEEEDGGSSDDDFASAMRKNGRRSRSRSPSKSPSKPLDKNKDLGKSLFDRVTAKPNTGSGDDSGAEQSAQKPKSFLERLTPKPGAESGDESGSEATGSKANPFGFPSAPPKINFGSTVNSGTELFGSRGSSPAVGESTDSIFGQSPKPGDHTWNPNTPIKFSNTNGTPSLNVTAASPSSGAATPKPFSNLFGAPSSNASSTTPKALSVGFNFGAPPASGMSSLAPSVLSSAGTSRATSPGATDTSANETDDEVPKDVQVSLMESRPGEENEDVLFEARAKLMKQDEDKIWVSIGVGPLRILKDKSTGKVRMVLRSDPGATVLLNTSVRKGIEYKPMSNGGKDAAAIRFADFDNDGKLAQKVLKVKTVGEAQEMGRILTDNAQ